MGMFGMGGKKKGGGEGDWGSDMVGMMGMLAGMPGMMRKPMMKGRINQLLALGEEQRQESIRQMFGAFHSPDISDKNREKLIATRVEVIGGLSEEKRRRLLTSRIEAMKTAADVDAADRAVQDRVMSKVSPKASAAFRASWNEVTSGNGT